MVNDPYLILDVDEEKNDNVFREEEKDLFHRSKLIEHLLERILHYSSDLNNPHRRQASLLWFLTFLIHCRRLFLQTPDRILFESKLFHIQTNLIYGLLDQDDLNQELACKCLMYVSETIENDDLKTKFNQKLFEQFSESSKVFANQQTTIAYEHHLQTNPVDNSQLLLYKELCSMIELVNVEKNIKSTLFYSFLFLAHDNSIWSSTRYGEIFRFDQYENKSIALISEHLQPLIARLYRLLYDPQTRVQDSIKRIWKKLFPSTKQMIIVEKYFNAIFKELFDEILSSRWRVRESIQLGLLEIFRLSNRKLIDDPQYIGLFQELFRRLFAVCDDTKESVRKAALSTINAFKQNCILLACDPATTISNASVIFSESATRNVIVVSFRMTEEEHRARGKFVLEQVLPILLHDGLYNKNEDIAKFSLTTISECCISRSIYRSIFDLSS